MPSAGKKSALFLGFGSFSFLVGAILVVYWPAIFFSQLKSMMILTNNSVSYDFWKETPIPMYLEFFMFNITNVKEIIERKAKKIKVEQVGPYVFRETHYKANVSFYDNGTVAFYNERYWFFKPELSNGSLTDQITTVNPVLMSLAFMRRFHSYWENIAINIFLKGLYSKESIFMTANATSWLFEGIEDKLINMANKLPFIEKPPYDRFGWFYKRNGSLDFDGHFLMNTGALDYSRLGNVEKWRNKNRTQYLDNCGVVQGSTGELWAPEIGQSEVSIFAPDMCMHMVLSKLRKIYLEGVEGVEYATNESVFDNGHKYPHTGCYCGVEREAECMPSGFLNTSQCRFNSPTFVSLPHFHLCDPKYPSKIDGLHPNSNHTFRLSLEMYTGMPMSVSAQLQVSMLMRSVEGLSFLDVLPEDDTLVPMFWFRQEVAITPQYARMAKFALYFRYWTPYGLYALSMLGICLMMTGILILMRRLLRTTEVPILASESSPNVSEVSQSTSNLST